ncbi:MAG TPA: sigma-70 family RNA polymerase sigma factor [Myxococcota bacterium]|nr:sigma-70 family RNA polymerase sigma factor [Myxococcota bacterium]
MVLMQRGDATAFELLLQRYRQRLFGFLLRRASPQHTEDLFQETWLRVVRARESFDPARRFSTWLFQIANNLCRDGARRSAVEAREQARLKSDVAAHGGAGVAALDAKLDAQQRLARLPERLREVLVLRYFEDLGEREIAEIVGVPPGTVKSRLHAAVRALRGAPEEHDVTH